MYSSAVSVGDIATASQYNNLRKDAGLPVPENMAIAYDAKGRIATVTNTNFSPSIVYTYSYDSKSDRLVSITDGTNTWTANYDSYSRLTSFSKT